MTCSQAWSQATERGNRRSAEERMRAAPIGHDVGPYGLRLHRDRLGRIDPGCLRLRGIDLRWIDLRCLGLWRVNLWRINLWCLRLRRIDRRWIDLWCLGFWRINLGWIDLRCLGL